MKAFEISDIKSKKHIGILLYYEKEKTFIVELKTGISEWDAPLLFSGFVKKGIYTIPRDISYAWISERVIPSGRQNISDILNRYHMKEYDEIKLLELSEGKCSQDDLYLKKTDVLPDYVLKRKKYNLTDFFLLDGMHALCFFEDETVRKIDLKKLGLPEHITGNRDLLDTCKVGCGGYYLTINDSIDISAAPLYEKSVIIPLSVNDFKTFIRENVCDTSGACEMLNCSRQNLSYLIKQEQIHTVKKDVNGNLFLKGEILRNMW